MVKHQYPKAYLYRRVVQSKLFIDHNFADPINLENIADEANFSKFHFIRLFKKTYAKTPHQYLIKVRIEKAKELLKTDCSIQHVCYAVGFESISSFTELFKKLIKLTPSSYQIQQHTIKAEIAKTPLKYIPNCFAEKKGWKKE